jgi:hypothetical protein
MDAIRGDDEVIALRVGVPEANFDMPSVFGYTSHRRFPTNRRSFQARAEKLHDVAPERATRASVWAPEARLVDDENQSTAGIAVLPSQDRHAPLFQRVTHTKLAQGPYGVAGKVQTKPGVRRSVQPFDELGCDSSLIKRTQHGEPGDAATDDEYAPRSAAVMLHSLPFSRTGSFVEPPRLIKPRLQT